MRLILILLSLAVSACATPSQYIETTGKFAEAVPPVAGAYRDYLTHIYYLDADTHLRLAELDKTTKVDPLTLTAPNFSAAALEARLEAVETLLLYSQALASASDLDLGGKFAEDAMAAGAAFDGLGKTINGFSADPTADVSKFAGPISQIVGLIGQSIIEAKQAAAIRTAILDAEPAVNGLISAMEEDVRSGSLLTLPSDAKLLAAAAIAYNTRIGKKGFAGKAQETALNAVKQEYTSYKNTKTLEKQLEELFKALKKANKALVRHAKVEGEENKMAALNDALASVQRLSSRAEKIRKAIEEMKK